MPRRSSKSKADWVSGADLINRPSSRRWVIGAAVLVVAAGLLIWLRPKAIAVDQVVPSGAVAYGRLDHVKERLAQLRASQFWQNFSKVDVSKVMEYAQVETKTIDGYNNWREKLKGTIDHPLFQQIFGREVAVAVYPVAAPFDPMNWTSYLAGTLMVTRIDAKAQVAESLATIWSQGQSEWTTERTKYKKNTITAVHFKQQKLTLYYARLKDLLVFSLNENLVASSIDTTQHKNTALNHDEDFSAMAGKFYSDADGNAYVHVPKVLHFLKQQLTKFERFFDSVDEDEEEIADESESSLDGLEEAIQRLEGVKLAGGSWQAGRPLKFKLNTLLDAQAMSPEKAALYACIPSQNPTLALIPKEAAAYQWFNCFDFKSYYADLKGSLISDDNNEPLAQLEEGWGFSLEKDLLPILGREFGWFVNGVDVKGLFPIPQGVAFFKTTDEKKAGDLIKRMVTTPITMVQAKDYEGFKIYSVTIPFFTSFRPSYAFVDGYALLSTSDDLIKSSIHVRKDPTLSLGEVPKFKELYAKTSSTGNAVTYVDMVKAVEQCRTFVGWSQKWLQLKIKQSDESVSAARRKIQSLQNKIDSKDKESKALQETLAVLGREEKDLRAAIDAHAVQAEAQDTLSKEGAVVDPAQPPGPTPADLKAKTAQIAASATKVEAIVRDIDDLQGQTADLEDEILDLEAQKEETRNLLHYVEEVLTPWLNGLQTVSSGLVHVSFGDHAVEAEAFLKTD